LSRHWLLRQSCNYGQPEFSNLGFDVVWLAPIYPESCWRLAALNAPGAHAAFEQALSCASDVAPRCLFADWLAAQPDDADRRRAGASMRKSFKTPNIGRVTRASIIASGCSARRPRWLQERLGREHVKEKFDATRGPVF
jgi:hypothetical protein